MVAADRDQADQVLDSLGRLRDRGGIEGVPNDDLGPANLEGRGLHRIADEHAQLVAAVDQLVRDATAEEAGRTQQQNPGHGSES